MTFPEILRLFGALDAAGLGLLFFSAAALGIWIENPGAARPSVTVLMAYYRREWMIQFLTRDSRIFDAQIIASLRQSTAFFASSCLIAIGGVLALIGNTATLEGVAEGLLHADSPALVWQIRLMPVVLLLANGFLKFVWSNRVFGYCAVMMAAVPNDATDPRATNRATRAADLNIRAALNFNRGLRAMYFALGALAWLVGPWALIAATLAVVWLVWSREFSSQPRRILMEGDTR